MSTQDTGSSLVSTAASVSALVNVINSLTATGEPSLYLDLEGVNLCREGTVSIVSIYVKPTNHVYLLDVHTLQSAAFSTPGVNDSTTIKSILESPTITKVFFDLRNDSDALHAHFGIRLQGVEDVQLMENASRPAGRRRHVSGLERCILSNARLTMAEAAAWKTAKDKGIALFDPSKGGSYEVFNVRPLSTDIERYCVNDVVYLPRLRAAYLARLDPVWRAKVAEETVRRVQESQSAAYTPHGRGKCLGPWEKPGRTYW